MRVGFVVAGVLVALYGVLLYGDRQRVARYLERQKVFGIVQMRKARKATVVFAVLFVLLGGLLLSVGLRP